MRNRELQNYGCVEMQHFKNLVSLLVAEKFKLGGKFLCAFRHLNYCTFR